MAPLSLLVDTRILWQRRGDSWTLTLLSDDDASLRLVVASGPDRRHEVPLGAADVQAILTVLSGFAGDAEPLGLGYAEDLPPGPPCDRCKHLTVQVEGGYACRSCGNRVEWV